MLLRELLNTNDTQKESMSKNICNMKIPNNMTSSVIFVYKAINSFFVAFLHETSRIPLSLSCVLSAFQSIGTYKSISCPFNFYENSTGSWSVHMVYH